MSGVEENYDYLLKYIIIGDAYVGKSNLLLRYAHSQFKPEYQITLGAEFGSKSVKIGDLTYRIQIWDTAGQENFRSITRSYYKSSVCALVVYDISSRESFNSINTWIEACKNQAPKTVIFILVGNKSDLEDKRQVTKEEGQEFADKYGILFYETSAKTGKNVDEMFYDSAKEIAKKIEQNYYDLDNDECGIKPSKKILNKKSSNSNGGVQLNNKQAPKKKKCC